jgi:hypothetical protein
VWIDGPVSFKVSAHPIEEGFSGITFWDFDGVVHTDEADSFVHELLDLVEMRNDRMASSAVGEDDDGLGVVEEFRIFRPEFGDFGFHREAGFLIESIGEEVYAVAPVVGFCTMAVAASDDGDLGFGVSGCREQGQEPEDVDEGFAYHNSNRFLEDRPGSCFWDNLTSRFRYRDGGEFWGELIFGVGGKGKGREAVEGGAEVSGSIASVHDNGDGYWISSKFTDDIEGFLDSAAFGDDVFGDEDFFARFKFETSSEGKVAVFFLQKDVAFSGLSGDFLADDESTHGGGDNGFKIIMADLLKGEFGHSGDGRHILADLGTLEKVPAVQT